MSIRNILITMMLVVSYVSSVSSQVARTDTVRSDLQKEFLQAIGDSTDMVVASSGSNNWFISFSAGVNSIFAEANRKYDNALQRSRFVARFSVGKWISPLWGVRFRVGVGELAGHYLPFKFYNIYEDMADHSTMPESMKPYLSEKDGQTWFHRKFTYMDFTVNFMTDVVRWFTPEQKRFGFVLFAGPGFSHGFSSQGFSASNSFAFKAGGQLNYRLNDKWDIIAELQGTIVDETFDGQIGGTTGVRNRTVEGYSSLTFGFSYKFGGKRFERYAKVNPVVYENIKYIMPPKVEEKKEEKPEDIISAFTVRFLIDSENIEDDQKLNIERVARYLRNNPEARLQLTGFADKETAYPEYNMKLSQRRVDAVRDYLVEKCGISEDRLVTDAMGDTQKVYTQDYRWNRAVVMQVVEEK